jgi:acyl-coenzyme A synthetase/AMP-(fatty) acid ligase
LLRGKNISGFSQHGRSERKLPKSIQLVDELPTGPSGKVQRLKLLEI